MITAQEVKEVVNKLFNSRWQCQVEREYLAMLRDVPTEIDLDVNPYVQSGVYANSGVTRTEHHPNMQNIIAMLYNTPTVTYDQQMNPDMNLLGPEIANLSTADIAEIVAMNGNVYLLNPMDSVAIHESIGVYQKMIRIRRANEPHFKAPPEEDMAAFEKLFNILESLAGRYNNKGEGNSALAELIRMTTKTYTGAITVDKKPVSPGLNISGLTNRAAIGLEFENNKDPFNFRNR